MYGTVAKMTVKPGQMVGLMKLMATPMHYPGFVAGYIYQMDADPNVLYMAAIFESKEAYLTNADRPEMNANFEKMMQFLVAEPEWHDGQVMKLE